MTRITKVRPYTKSNGTNVRGHSKRTPQSKRKRKQIKEDEEFKKQMVQMVDEVIRPVRKMDVKRTSPEDEEEGTAETGEASDVSME